MRNLTGVLAAVVSVFVSVSVFAQGDADSRMYFQIKNDSKGTPDIAGVFNPALDTLTLRTTILYTGASDEIGKESFSAKDAKTTEFVLRNAPGSTLACSEVVSTAFEYSPEMPEYILYVTLKGPACNDVAAYLKASDLRIRFLDMSVLKEGANVSLDILNTAKFFN